MTQLKPLIITGSYNQDQRHGSQSLKYNPIQPSAIGIAMANHGLSLANLKTGRARHEDKADFQRTFARYRGPEIAAGIFLDIVHVSNKLGRGQDLLLAGLFRLICTNGLGVSKNFFNFKIRHTGDTYDNLDTGIAATLAMQGKIGDVVKAMQGTQLTSDQAQDFAQSAARLLVPANADRVAHRLLGLKRVEDDARDLWTVFNVVQENAMRGRNVAYTIKSLDDLGRDRIRQMNVRAIGQNTARDSEFNGALFDLALKVAA